VAKKILIVDDEERILKMTRIRLESSGYKIITASDGKDGFKKAQKEQPDLIILDIILPKLDGYKVCRMLKFDDKYKKIPIILFSARAGESDKDMGKDVGADFFLPKPLNSEILLEKIEELLNKDV